MVSEDTDRVIGERRLATLRDLGSDPSVVRTETETVDFAARQLAKNPRDLPFTLTYLAGDDGTARLAGATGIGAGHPAAPAAFALDAADPVWPAPAVMRGQAVLVELDSPVCADLPTGDWTDPPTQALMLPLLRQGHAPYGFLVAALNRYRPLDAEYHGFVELVGGHLAAGIAAARSYLEQQQRAEALAELDRAKTTFFSNISHEFRTPLTLILGPIEELRHRLDLDERDRDELEIVHRNGLRLSKLVNTLLDFSRLEAGRMQAWYEPVEVATVTAELSSVFRSAVDRAGLVFEVDCPPLDEPVYLDRGMWEKVIFNLLSNALKFTFDGSIAVRVSAENSWAVVTVADTGVGVPAAEVPRLFERFHRIENARSRSHEGSGIGLALVKELVDLHGGTITADSVEGRGTTFTVRLPFGTGHLPAGSVAPAAEAAPTVSGAGAHVEETLRWLPTARPDTSGAALPPGPAASHSAAASAAPRVLIADDNADMRDYLTRLLTEAGYRVEAVPDGHRALTAARASAFDMIVSDVMMPGLDGLSLVAALRADSRTAAVPVLLLSARAGQEASIEGLQAGADDYLVKPFAAAELLARVRTNVELARIRTHHIRWRTALIDSLQEAFFVCDENGAVVEINAAFTDILGYDVDGLPYQPIHPWWPDADLDPEGHRQVADAFAGLLDHSLDRYTIPVTHRDGHRLWISAHFNPARDPDAGQRVTVGTFRDVTAEHYAIRRESALAALSTRLSQATSVPDALAGALTELQELWDAEHVVAAVFDHGDEPTLTGTDPAATWTALPSAQRRMLTDLHHQAPLTTVADPTGTAVLLEHPHGPLAVWIGTGRQRPFAEQDHLLLSLLAGRLAQGLTRLHQIDQQRETAIALQRAILGPSQLPDGLAELTAVHRPVTAESPAPGDPGARDHGDSAHHGRR